MIADKMRAALLPLGYPIYDPGQYDGKCKTPYLVIMYAGSQANPGTRLQGHIQMDVIEYVPIASYDALKTMHARVMSALAQIGGCKWPDSVSPDIIESDYGAYSRTVSYRLSATFD